MIFRKNRSNLLYTIFSLFVSDEYHRMEKEAAAAGQRIRTEVEARIMKLNGKLNLIQGSQKRQKHKVRTVAYWNSGPPVQWTTETVTYRYSAI